MSGTCRHCECKVRCTVEDTIDISSNTDAAYCVPIYVVDCPECSYKIEVHFTGSIEMENFYK